MSESTNQSTILSKSIVRVASATRLRGDFQLPGDKSISHRSAMFAAIGEGVSRLSNYSSARDCQSTLNCLEALGVKIERKPELIVIEGAGIDGLREAARALDVGNSGSTIRMLSGILAGQNFTTEITGDESIQRRPMKRVIDPLVMMGARIESREGGFAPLVIHGGNLKAIEYTPPVASAQVKSCALLAGLFADGVTTVIEKTPTRNHTEVMMRECGAAIEVTKTEAGERISVTGRKPLGALGDYIVAGDQSSASFFIVAALIVPDAELRLRHIGINPSRTALMDALKSMGARIEIENPRVARGEPVADILIRSSNLNGDLELSGEVIANLIDEIPILAIAGARLDGTLTIRDARELRVKESDRIRSIVDNLRRMEVEVEEFDDGLRLRGGQRLRGARVDSFDDHRIAMSFAVAGLIAEGETEILNADAASVSLPEFYNLLAASGAKIDIGR
ncbi:MAG TPA: 3-phosphoshikimate 1-carboxyvinyltransferase [Blastocatellia bacterium]|nr:3-phosphoshikimate 1-carboxyvinyltransferase [Blastocatellia bacterium]